MENDIFAREILYQGMSCIELGFGGYYAVLAPEIGSNMLRLRDEKNKIEFFRYNEELSVDELKKSSVVYGFPTLYLPNRIDKGVLKTSDAVYNFPINEGEPFNNYIHGFLHKRPHKVIKLCVENDSAAVTTEYLYDENDEMFSFFPLKFKAEITFILSENGLEQFVTLTNLSSKMLPAGLCSHTAIKAPFCDGGDINDIRLYIPVGEKLELDSRCLPTEAVLPLAEYDMQYRNGTVNPATSSIVNEMYFAKTGSLNGDVFHGAIAEDISNGKRICYETGEEYNFWLIWNQGGNKGFFCPEPMSWMINAPNLSLPAVITGYREIAPEKSFTAYQRIFSLV